MDRLSREMKLQQRLWEVAQTVGISKSDECVNIKHIESSALGFFCYSEKSDLVKCILLQSKYRVACLCTIKNRDLESLFRWLVQYAHCVSRHLLLFRRLRLYSDEVRDEMYAIHRTYYATKAFCLRGMLAIPHTLPVDLTKSILKKKCERSAAGTVAKVE